LAADESSRYRLSICIPTYNRDVYLESLLARIAAEVEGRGDVQIVISDNASTDRTPDVVARWASRADFVCVRRETNGGAERNFLAVVEAAAGEYCWIFGDDDVLLPGGVARVLALLGEHDPELLHVSTETLPLVEQTTRFNGLAEFVEHFARVQPRMLLDVTLVTAAIFRRSRWLSIPDKERFIPTRYLHALVIAESLRGGGRIVLVPDRVISVRRERAAFAEHGIVREIPFLQLNYLLTLAALTGSDTLLRYCRRLRVSALGGSARMFARETARYVRNAGAIVATGIRCLFAPRRGSAE